MTDTNRTTKKTNGGSLYKMISNLSHKIDKQEKVHQEILDILKAQNKPTTDINIKQDIKHIRKKPEIKKQEQKKKMDIVQSDYGFPLMLLSQMLKNKISEPDAFDELIVPDTKRNIFKQPICEQYDNFVELKFNSLDDICTMGQLFTGMNDVVSKDELTPKENNIINTAFEILEPNSTMDIRIIPLFDEKKPKKEIKQDMPDNNGLYLFKDKRYSVNPQKLMKLVKPIQLLNSMVGMNEIKKSIFNFISNFLHNTHNNGMLNTAIYGKPGIGKTDLGKILCMIYSALGIVQNNKFKLVKASDLIGQFVGHTRQKTKEVLEESNGGVLFIDEAYALTNCSSDRVSFGKECIDTINQELSENRHNLVIIIAGYEREIQEGFFNVNPGLERRFPFRYVLKEYNKEDMKNIFLKMLRINKDVYLYSNTENDKENVSMDDLLAIFNDMKYFDNCGGDIENLITQISIANSTRTFGKHPAIKNIYTKSDIKTGLEMFKKSKINVLTDEPWNSVYI